MNKIIKALLEAKFQNVNVDALLQIIDATPNPEKATEILCGLHEAPDFDNHYQIYEDSDKTRIYTFVSYDPLKREGDAVIYEYESKQTKGAYFPKELSKADINLENFDSLSVKYSENAKWLDIETGKIEKSTSSMSLSRWMSKTVHSIKQ